MIADETGRRAGRRRDRLGLGGSAPRRDPGRGTDAGGARAGRSRRQGQMRAARAARRHRPRAFRVRRGFELRAPGARVPRRAEARGEAAWRAAWCSLRTRRRRCAQGADLFDPGQVEGSTEWVDAAGGAMVLDWDMRTKPRGRGEPARSLHPGKRALAVLRSHTGPSPVRDPRRRGDVRRLRPARPRARRRTAHVDARCLPRSSGCGGAARGVKAYVA